MSEELLGSSGRPIVDQLHHWLAGTLSKVSASSEIASAINYS
jgi:hypothetical protein